MSLNHSRYSLIRQIDSEMELDICKAILDCDADSCPPIWANLGDCIAESRIVSEIEIGEGATTGDLLSELVEQYGEKLGRILFGSDRKNL